ncbi:recombinase XerD [Streptomyces dangxiongensis]|uniref:Recombinase XerD n=1 Tax=Streptomyces dangxiongensis TaxID=1442032 RepID=A0A3G2JKW2_9ACTN|nr:site-specific integrase [Streptomyces dangxiongensis]AYN40197.1 recombinase XerD [Streptomyces dangxiongensis]
MDHFFVSPSKVRRFYEAPAGVDPDFDAEAYVRRPGAVKEGTPFYLDSDMRPLEPLCSFFLELSKTLKAKSLQDYGYDAMDVVEFLAELDPPADLLSATEEDLVAYREDCTEYREKPDEPATWKRRRATINRFYDWATDPRTKLLEERPYYRRPNGRDVLSWGAVSELDVRHLTYRQWRFLKQVGLRGYLPDGRLDPAFRCRTPLRNSVAPELAITTGMRSREFSSLLDIEVGPPRRDASPAEVALRATAKRGWPRTAAVQDPTLRELDLYRRTERAAMVRASAKSLYKARAELFVVDDIDLRKMELKGVLHGRRRTFKVAGMPAEIRRIAVTEGDRGLEAMALFLGRGGRMLSKQRWGQIFDEAHLRALRLSEEYKSEVVMPARLRIHDTRHTFAIYMLHVLTHLLLREEAERYLAGDHSAFFTDHLSRNPLLILQRILGHQSPKTTLRYLTYIRDTNALVTKAIAEWNDRESTYADYASALADREVA